MLFGSKKQIFRFSKWVCTTDIVKLLFLFLMIFPKGGVKYQNVPITWGYFLFTLIGGILMFRPRFFCSKTKVLAFVFLIPFQLISLITLLINGTIAPGLLASFLFSFFLIPFFCLMIFSESIDLLPLSTIELFLKKSMLFVALYGLVIFVVHGITGYILEIPFLTVNYHDVGNLATKCNSRAFLLKLFSTYNNGNIFGISLLIFLPVYCYWEKRFFPQFCVKLALLLTLSRTVWIGLLLNEILFDILIYKQIRKALLKTGIIISLILTCLHFLGFPLYFMFNKNLGGRAFQLDILQTSSLFSDRPFSGILEISYLGVLDQFGYVGLFTYVVGLFFPLWLYGVYKKEKQRHQKALALGLFIYLFIAASDGAVLLIPVMAFFWLNVSLLFKPDPKIVPAFDKIASHPLLLQRLQNEIL